jgi:hypothetical protein
MVEEARSWFRQNSTLIYFLIAQAIAVGGGAAALIAYSVRLETRVMIMETRGAEYTVARMEEMKLKINRLEQQIEANENSIKRIIDIMTRELGKKDSPKQ